VLREFIEHIKRALKKYGKFEGSLLVEF